MKRCKHQTGKFFETIAAVHQRNVINGELDTDSFNNEYGDGISHTYECSQCGKWWRWIYLPRQKWLNKLFVSAYKEHDN